MSKIAIGCLVQWYEIEMIQDYIQSVNNALDYTGNREDITVHFRLVTNQDLEKIDESKMTLDKIESKFKELVKDFDYDITSELHTIADYRRWFNDYYCEKVDILMWGESDSLIPRQTFNLIEMLQVNVEAQDYPKFIATFGINKMWDDSWKPLEHIEFTDKPFIEDDTKNWWSIPYNMSIDEMNTFNDKVEEIQCKALTNHKFNGCGLIISSEVVKSGVNIPRSSFFINEDTAFMLMMQKVLGKVPQFHFRNILIVHNRKHPQKRNYILGEQNDIYIDKNRTNHKWYNTANQYCQYNNRNLFSNKKAYTWKDVWKVTK